MSCVIPFVEIQVGGHVFCTLSKFKAFLLVFENVENRTVLVKRIALTTMDLSKILRLLLRNTYDVTDHGQREINYRIYSLIDLKTNN